MALHFAEPDRLRIGLEPKYDSDPADWPFEATKAYLNKEATLAKTVAKFTTPIDGLYTKGYESQARSCIWFIGLTFCAMLPQIPSDHPAQTRLVDLVVALRKHVLPGSGEARAQSIWKRLQLPECRYADAPADELMELTGRDSYYDPQYELDGAGLGVEAIKDEWTRHNAFRARLMSIATAEDCQISDLDMDALIAFQAALEEPSKSKDAISANIPAAAVYMIYAGKHIHACQSTWPDHWAPAEGGPLWHGKKGYCPERWALWKARFTWVLSEDGFTDEAKRFARLAVNAMEEVEISI